MNTYNIKSVSASIIALTLTLGAIPQAFAASQLYPGSMCSFERQGTNGTLDKRKGSIKSSAHTGNIVTCPIPHSTPTGFTGASKAVSVSVNFQRQNSDASIRCAVQWTSFDNGQPVTEDSEIHNSDDYSANELFWEQLLIPVQSWVVLRCHLPNGARIGGYRASSID